MSKKELCGFSGWDALGKRSGYHILGADRRAAPRLSGRKTPTQAVAAATAAVAPRLSGRKTPTQAVAAATAAVARAATAGNAALRVARTQPRVAKPLQKITGLGETENFHLLGLNEKRNAHLLHQLHVLGFDEKQTEFLLAQGSEILGLGETENFHLLGVNERRHSELLAMLGVDSNDPGAEYAAQAAYEVLGAAGASQATRVLAARAAASSAALAAAKARAAQAPAKIAKANASIERHAKRLVAHAQKASNAQARGQAALAQSQAGKAAITEQVNRLGKLGVKIKTVMGADMASDKVAYEKMPGDAVQFPVGKAFDNGSVGSWSMYYGPVAPTGTRIGYGWDGTQWVFVGIRSTGAGVEPSPIPLPGSSTQGVSRLSTGGQIPQYPGNALSSGSAVLAGGTFGPLIGDPNNPDYAGLHYSPGDDKWWWKADEAPSYATQERDEAVALLQRQTDEANEAAAAAEQAAADQAQAQADADAAARQAAWDIEDAERARKAQQQAEDLQLADDKLQAELAEQQARDDAATASAQAQADQAQYQYQAAHPEQYAPPPAPSGGYDGGGYGGGYGAPPSSSREGDNVTPEDVTWAENADDRGTPFPGEYPEGA